jgi:hypothetical protein
MDVYHFLHNSSNFQGRNQGLLYLVVSFYLTTLFQISIVLTDCSTARLVDPAVVHLKDEPGLQRLG